MNIHIGRGDRLETSRRPRSRVKGRMVHDNMTQTAKMPLGACENAGLTGEQVRALQVIESYDLTGVRERLIRNCQMSPRWADRAIFEFRRFLGLHAVLPDIDLRMLSPDVDEVWHTSLLFSRAYADLCEQAFGYFVHHEPAAEAQSDSPAAWQEFEESYRRVYGDLGFLWRLSRPEEPC
jgi:hypothetical protein